MGATPAGFLAGEDAAKTTPLAASDPRPADEPGEFLNGIPLLRVLTPDQCHEERFDFVKPVFQRHGGLPSIPTPRAFSLLRATA
jgi:hypothetical protein